MQLSKDMKEKRVVITRYFESENGGGGMQPIIKPLTATANEIYKAPTGIDGFNPVKVNVAVEGRWDDFINIWNENKDEKSYLMYVFSNSNPTNLFLQSGGSRAITSDGFEYLFIGTGISHTWDSTKDVKIGDDFFRWAIIKKDDFTSLVDGIGSGEGNAIFVLVGAVMPTILSFGFQDSLILKKIYYELNVPNIMTPIINNSFRGTLIEEFIIPDGAPMIGSGAFENCVALKELTISSGVGSFGTDCFKNCTALQKINIPIGYVMPIGFDISGSIFFPETSAIELFENLGVAPAGRTLYFGQTLLTRWSAGTKAIATNKGYILA